MWTPFAKVVEDIKAILAQYRSRVFELSRERDQIVKESVHKLEEEKIRQLQEDLRNNSL